VLTLFSPPYANTQTHSATEEFYAYKADEMKMSAYTLELDGRANLKTFDKSKLGHFQPFNSADRQEILYTELQDRVNLQSLLKRQAVKCIIPLHCPQDQIYILNNWMYVPPPPLSPRVCPLADKALTRVYFSSKTNFVCTCLAKATGMENTSYRHLVA
jgi:hypothetical protein